MHEESLYGIAAHWHYKQISGDQVKSQRQPTWVKEILDIQRKAENTSEFISQIKLDVFGNRIFVFSPQGDVFDLPEHSTPVDFAYLIHTEIGNKASGALINNKMLPLNTELKNGDSIEIIMDKNRKGPNRDWLKFVKTNRAKDKIKHALKDSKLEKLRNLIPGM
jgi:GTP pyrophosphokinase